MLKSNSLEWGRFAEAARNAAVVSVVLALTVYMGTKTVQSWGSVQNRQRTKLEIMEQELTAGYQLAGVQFQSMVEEWEQKKNIAGKGAWAEEVQTAEAFAAESMQGAEPVLPAGDYKILQKIVQAESGNCDLKGKILVANVVMNRVNSGKFPDTVRDVVYQKSQFSPVSNGSIDRCTVSAQTKEAVDRALAGEDYSQGALYFMNRAAAKAGSVRWFDQELTYLFRHGGHEFYR